jgi:hypothetical protein
MSSLVSASGVVQEFVITRGITTPTSNTSAGEIVRQGGNFSIKFAGDVYSEILFTGDFRNVIVLKGETNKETKYGHSLENFRFGHEIIPLCRRQSCFESMESLI